MTIVGEGMVGFKFLEKFVGLGGNGEYNIRVFGDEPWPAYDRVHLTGFFSGKTAERLTLGSRLSYEENRIELNNRDANYWIGSWRKENDCGRRKLRIMIG